MKRTGILLHTTSLPSRVLDQDAERWIDWMANQGFNIWQVLPLNIPQWGLSPYTSISAFAVNPELFGSNLELEPRINQAWLKRQSFWIKDFARFVTLRNAYDQKPWQDWPEALAKHDEKALKVWDKEHKAEMDAIYLQQWTIYKRWQQIKKYANKNNIDIFGDIPIFVALDSADVWANQQEFLLDEKGQPTFVAGVPPDYFSATGQRWGNPQYNWALMQKQNFAWWIKRIAHQLDWFNVIRIDHFRGLESSWFIPAHEETAMNGYWQKVPGAELLKALRDELGDLPLVAEDLGLITDEVNALREAFQLPGMSILQFGFDGLPHNPHHPAHLHGDRFVYTGTHDNETLMGWWNNLPEETRAWIYPQFLALLPEELHNLPMPYPIIAAGLAAKTAAFIMPLQDILALDNSGRMNTPGTIENNWMWHFNWQDLTPEIEQILHQLHQGVDQSSNN